MITTSMTHSDVSTPHGQYDKDRFDDSRYTPPQTPSGALGNETPGITPEKPGGPSIDIDDQIHNPRQPPQTLHLSQVMAVISEVLPKVGFKDFTASDFETLTPQGVNMMLTQLTLNNFRKMGKLICEQITAQQKLQEDQRNENVKRLSEQIRAQQEAAEKAKKAGIFTAVIDTIVAAAEVISGAMKLLAANPTGVLDIAAGAAGFVKAGFEWAAAFDPDNAEKYLKIAAEVGYVQLAFEMLGMLSEVRGAMHAKGAMKPVIQNSTENVIKKGGGEFAENINKALTDIAAAVDKSAKQQLEAQATKMIKDTAEKIGADAAKELLGAGEQVLKEALDEAGGQVLKEAVNGKQLLKEALDSVHQSPLMRTLNQKSISEFIAEGVNEAAQKAFKMALKEGGQVTAETLTTQCVDKVVSWYRMTKKVAAAMAYSWPSVIKGVPKGFSGAMQIPKSQLDKLIAEKIEYISRLDNDTKWALWLIDMLSEAKEEKQKELEYAVENNNKNISEITKNIKVATSSLVNIANAII
ncbi:type III secretion system translocon subunit SctE [Aeromonas jandaei]|uniref:type III secretion system translocon subunit SctE n=1 Tax=Aeromonas jandaei TaxID=650 RepID=UPI003BA208A2